MIVLITLFLFSKEANEMHPSSKLIAFYKSETSHTPARNVNCLAVTLSYKITLYMFT